MLLGQPGGGGGLSRGWKGTRQGRAPKGGGAPVGRCVCGCLGAAGAWKVGSNRGEGGVASVFGGACRATGAFPFES